MPREVIYKDWADMRAIDAVSEEDIPKLTVGTKYCVAGVVNADWKMYLRTKFNCTVFRIPVITWDGMQCVVDIWCDNRSQEPRYEHNWQKFLQWTVIQGANFKQKITAYGIDLYHFKVNTSNRQNRYIWMSAPDRNFWLSPVDDPENSLEIRRYNFIRKDCASVRGVLNRSKGSCFGEWVSEKDKAIHSHQMVSGLFFADHKHHLLQYKQKIVGGFLELMLVDGRVVKHDDDRLPLFHRLVLHFYS